MTVALIILTLLSPSAPPASLTLAFVGDVMLGRDVATALDDDWPAALAGVRPWLAGADLTFANLESPLTRAPFAGGRFDLRAPPQAVNALTAAGFDVVSLANNHALDGGEAGLAETLATLRRAGIAPLLDAGARRFGRIAVLSFFDTGQPLDTRAISQAAAQADFVVVSVHWGAEYYPVTTVRQRRLAQEFVAAGAKLVIGHGPHVLQAVERVQGALVAYSLGNFLFDQPFPDTRQGAILRITLDRGSISLVQAIPTVTRRGRVHLASGEQAAAILARLRLSSH